ncbi:hypothetical protein NDU88_002586 [Pleurodeles waltl]|uniref:Secreted protein n=1 Tax=Pleurodeles waltl TaxID=8319 RepID=A0AAV7NJ18_PLEWA|nr:hypothetical protein NDU88_002586 [Pleurodeles waltl]
MFAGGAAATAAADMHCQGPPGARPTPVTSSLRLSLLACAAVRAAASNLRLRAAHTEPLSHTEWHKLSAIIMMVGLGHKSSSARKRYQLTAQPKIIGLLPRHYLKCLRACDHHSQSAVSECAAHGALSVTHWLLRTW